MRHLEMASTEALFTAYTTGSSAAGEAFLAQLDPAHCARLDVYRQSFRARVVSVLESTLLAPVSRIFGAPLVAATLARYFASRPPQAARLTDALDGFQAFVEEHASGPSQPLFVALVAASLARWQLLTGADPEPTSSVGLSLEAAQLTLKPCKLIPGHGSKLFTAWVATIPDGPEAYLDGESEWLLVVKTSATDLASLAAAEDLVPFIATWASGVTLQEALDQLTESQTEAMNPALFGALITSLAASGALMSEEKGWGRGGATRRPTCK